MLAVLCAAMPSAYSQVTGADGKVIDTTAIYGERSDSLDAAVFVSRQAGNYLSKGKEIRTEVISAAGLCKMACCNLAESFENSASVTVGYSDAVTGARQIRLLGLSGAVIINLFIKLVFVFIKCNLVFAEQIAKSRSLIHQC